MYSVIISNAQEETVKKKSTFLNLGQQTWDMDCTAQYYEVGPNILCI